MPYIFAYPKGATIFSFAAFISGLALLIIVYTVSDVRYRFRIAVAPIPLYRITYLLIIFIGFGTLLTDLLYSELSPTVALLTYLPICQAVFGAIFLILILIWVYIAFIDPPIFSKKNYIKYANILFQYILKGSGNELPIIASEIARSAISIVKLSSEILNRPAKRDLDTDKITNIKPNAANYAHDVLILLGNRKLCRNIIAFSPGTAIAFFNVMTDIKKYNIPIRQFSKNISTEVIINKDSILYHEDEGFSSGLIGYLKPFSQAIYGNYELVETLASNQESPLDIRYELVSSWDAAQLEVYCRCVLITMKSYIKSDKWPSIDSIISGN